MLRPQIEARRAPRAAALLAVLAWLAAGPALAQPVTPPFGEVQTSGLSYFTYAEPGAPTIEVMVVGEGARTGVYRIQEGTTLTRLLVLGGNVPSSEETERRVTEAFVRVLRETGGTRATVYEATTEQALREPQAHPALQDGDVVELDVTYEELPEPFTFRQGIQIASSVASIALLILRIASY